MTDRTIVNPEPQESFVPQTSELYRQVDNLQGRTEAQVAGQIVNSELVRKNIDTIAAMVASVPDAMFPLDATKLPALKAVGIEKIEKHGSTYTVTQDKAERLPIHQGPVDSIEIGKQFSFHIGQNPQTGMATFDHIQGVNVHASALGHDISVPVHSIEHNKQGEAKFRVNSGIPGGFGEIKVDVALQKDGQVKVSRPAINIGGKDIELGGLMPGGMNLTDLNLPGLELV